MPIASELVRLTDEEANDLDGRVERFRAGWKTDGTTGIDGFLPPPGTRHRVNVLVRLILADMELRALTGLHFRAENYLATFADDLPGGVLPVAILAGEYQLRHRFGDRPDLEEYRARFPAQFAGFAAEVAKSPPPSQTVGPRDHTPLTSVEVIVAPPGAAEDPKTHGDGRTPSGKSPHPGADLVVADSVQFSAGQTKPRAGDSTSATGNRTYTLVRKLGKGAYGEVFEALAPGGIPVALKRILRTVDDPISQLEQEALDSIKKLSHPFLLKTNAYWVEGDRLMIVMELAEYSLADRLEHYQRLGRTGMPVKELIPLFQQASEALDYLHAQNVSHRDVKPENILVQRGYAKVADFGLVRQHKHTMTEVQSTAGTPAYMAPEMWKQKVSLHSDQYALAATYVKVRLGRYLFNVTSWIDQGNAHVSETPSLDPLPPEEQAVLLRALAKNPDNRFPSCSEFANALRDAVFPPPPPPPPTPERARDSRWKAILSTAMIALVCAASVWAVSYFNRPPQPMPTTPDQTKKGQNPEPAKQHPAYPQYWEPVAADGLHPNPIDGKYYHHTLARTLGGQELRARLILPTNPGDPAPFYMTEHKITNRVFQTVWDNVSMSTDAAAIRAKGGAYLPESWQQDESGKPLDIADTDAKRPVLGVTLPQALLVARELGGEVPTYRQWLKATGLLEPGTMDGPAGPEVVPTGSMPRAERIEWMRKELHGRKLALLREQPLAVDDPEGRSDYSRRWKIYQLVTNGQEWIDQRDPLVESRFSFNPLPALDKQAVLVGHSHFEDHIDRGSNLKFNPPGMISWTEVKGVRCGFRLVIELK